jgi:hypothetical protein
MYNNLNMCKIFDPENSLLGHFLKDIVINILKDLTDKDDRTTI